MPQSLRGYLKAIVVLGFTGFVFWFYYYTVIASYEQYSQEVKTALSDPYLYMWFR